MRALMASLKHRCRICKAVMEHMIVKVTDNLPPNVEVLECMGCGVLGVELLEVDESALLKTYAVDP
jgi:MinD superfamily P-loop ATPase